MNSIYLDFQATTPLDPRVLDAMLPWLSAPANPHATENEPGRRARDAVEYARVRIAELMGAAAEDVVFTSGATEAANIVLRSIGRPGTRIVHSAIEHPCVSETAADLAQTGVEIDIVPVDADGLVDTEALDQLLDPPPALVSIMAVNNEIGTIQPIRTIARTCRLIGTVFHTDCVQAAGRIPLALGQDFDVATISAHKIYGPQGIGAIVASAEIRQLLRPIATGGGQERGIRPGTTPVALAVGMGEAALLAVAEMERDRTAAAEASALLLAGLKAAGLDPVIYGSLDSRVPHNLNISFDGIPAEELLARAPQLALSTGSACSSGAIEPSRVLLAMGIDKDQADGAIRIGFGRTTSRADVEAAVKQLSEAVRDATAVYIGVGK